MLAYFASKAVDLVCGLIVFWNFRFLTTCKRTENALVWLAMIKACIDMTLGLIGLFWFYKYIAYTLASKAVE